MKPINLDGHSAYQSRVLAQLRKYYPDADSPIDAATSFCLWEWFTTG